MVRGSQDLVNSSSIPENLGNFHCLTPCLPLSVKARFRVKGLSYLSDHYKISPENFILFNYALILTVHTPVTGNCKVPLRIIQIITKHG